LCPTTRTDLPALICGAIPDARWRTSQNPTGGSVKQPAFDDFPGQKHESESSEWREALPAQFGATEYLRIGSCEAFSQIPFSQGNAKMWRHA